MEKNNQIPNSTAVLVLGIVSIPTCLCFGVVGFVCSIIALVLASSGMKEYNLNSEKYMNSSLNNLKAGKICAIIGLVLSSLYLTYYLLIVLLFGGAFSQMPWDEMMQVQ